MDINLKIEELLRNEHGADIVGFADVDGLAPEGYKYAVVAALVLPAKVIDEIPIGPTPEYDEVYHDFNNRLEQMAHAVADMLNEMGYRSAAWIGEKTTYDEMAFKTELPYKTVATRAGIGWVGKSDLLVTPQFGSAIRLTVALTDAPIVPSEPVTESRCGACTKCVEACPGKAIKNNLWYPGIELSELVDIPSCRKAARDLAEVTLGYRTTMCGRCFAACPYTQNYLKRIRNEE
ncbi:MAG: epoxyqueuosine reductase [Clostridia bacterium]|nr:epoxyqueuosine reductase [Clostridia bacterium]